MFHLFNSCMVRIIYIVVCPGRWTYNYLVWRAASARPALATGVGHPLGITREKMENIEIWKYKIIKTHINLICKADNTKKWFTLCLRAQFIVDLHFLLDSQHRILSNYNEVLIKSYRKFVNIMNLTPRGSVRKL